MLIIIIIGLKTKFEKNQGLWGLDGKFWTWVVKKLCRRTKRGKLV